MDPGNEISPRHRKLMGLRGITTHADEVR